MVDLLVALQRPLTRLKWSRNAAEGVRLLPSLLMSRVVLVYPPVNVGLRGLEQWATSSRNCSASCRRSSRALTSQARRSEFY
jgi:hypothetical protein